MRTIKFRGKSILDDSDRKWLYGDLSTDRLKEGKCTIWDENNPFSGYYVDPETVGQFTGLLDKNGGEIYEGDVLQYTDEKGKNYCREVVCNDGAFCQKIYMETLKTAYTPLRNHDLKLWQIVGNIHDNPELLKGDRQ